MRVPEVDWVKGLRKCCEDISDDAENIIGNLHNVRSISIEINMDPGSVITYTVKHERLSHGNTDGTQESTRGIAKMI